MKQILISLLIGSLFLAVNEDLFYFSKWCMFTAPLIAWTNIQKTLNSQLPAHYVLMLRLKPTKK